MYELPIIEAFAAYSNWLRCNNLLLAGVYNLLNLGRHLVSANHYRYLRVSAFSEWNKVVA